MPAAPGVRGAKIGATNSFDVHDVRATPRAGGFDYVCPAHSITIPAHDGPLSDVAEQKLTIALKVSCRGVKGHGRVVFQATSRPRPPILAANEAVPREDLEV